MVNKTGVPSRTRPETHIFRLRNKGFPHLHAYGTGDEHVRIFVEVPQSLNKEQTRTLKEYAKTIGEDSTPLRKSFLERLRKII